MMKIEKEFAKKDYSVFKIEPKKLLAKQIVQYQNFKTEVILNKMNKMNFKDSTVLAYVTYGLSYIHTGRKNKRGGIALYDFIDEHIRNCVTPYIPKQEEKRIFKKASKQNIEQIEEIDNKEVEDINKNNNEILSYISYGVKLEKNIILFYSKVECEAFIKGLNYNTENNSELVKLNVEIVK